MKTNKQTIITIYALLFGAISFYSCENPVGLGSLLHLNPPVLTITKPDFMSDIGETLEISGSARDDQEVTYLYITVTGDKWKGEWVSCKGDWSGRTALNDKKWDIQGDAGSVEWKASIPTDEMPDGEYQISVRAENNVKNSAAVSVQERRVIIDHNPPVITMMQPELTKGHFVDIQPEFDKYNLLSSKDLNRLLNGQIQAQWEVVDNFSIGSVIVRLMDKEKSYYEKKLDNPGYNGKLTIAANEIQETSDGGTVPVLDKTYLRIQTEAIDKAGNSDIENHGWLVYWPEADKPWAEGVPSQIYGGTEVQCQAYDDDGLKLVEYQLYKKDSDTPLSGYETPRVKENLPPAEGINPSGSFNWSFSAPRESLEYTIKIICTDINDIRGDTLEYHFSVMDTSAPDAEFTAPLMDKSLFGDANGNFCVQGNVSDGSDPRRATLVWINPNGGNPTQSRNDYLSADYAGWNNSGIDAGKNKIWELTLGDLKPANENQDRFKKEFKHTINLFTDLGITLDGVPLKAQTFIVRSEGSGGRAITKSHTVMGDVIPPDLITITTIEVKDQNDVTLKTYTKTEWEKKGLDLLNVGERIYLSGTWHDDSLDTWTSAAGGKVRIETAWSDKTISNPPVYDYAASPKTWKTGPFIVDEDMAKDGAGYISAKITDLGGNSNEANLFVQKDTSIPDLIRISSDNDNKAYKAGDVITIYLEFNKGVNYTPPSGSEDRTLTLDSGGTASFVSVNSENTKFYFSYTVQNNDNTNDLNVRTINFAGTWGSQANPSADSVKQNLAYSKNIVIDTTNPAISKIESLTTASSRGNKHFNKGQKIQLLVTFSEDIQWNETGIQLKLNTTPSAYAKFEQSRGSNAILFSYTVEDEDTQTANQLKVTGIELPNSNSISDKAGNLLDTTAWQDYNTGFIIDTTLPSDPLVHLTGAFDNNNNVYTEEPKFTLTGTEQNASVEYSINGSSFVLYSGEVTVRGGGKHTVIARQTDLAGNTSPDTTVQFETKIDKALVQRLSGIAKTYKAGEIIYIDLVLREPVTIVNGNESNFKLKLNVTPDQFAKYKSGSTTNTLRFEYVVQDNDKIYQDDYLKINSYEKTPDVKLKTTSGSDITDELKPVGKKPSEGDTWTDNLPNYAQIKIDTVLPKLDDVTDDYQAEKLTLNLTFNKAIQKGTGNIVLTHEDSANKLYRAPAVLTEQEYTRFGGSTLGTYYKAGTNGTDSSYNPDLSTKYILDYQYNDNTEDVLNALKQNNAHKVIVSVNSSSVNITDKTLTITNISLPVKGVKYIITFDKGIVKDTLGSTVDALDNTKGKITKKIPGVNTPFIRVNKKETTPILSGNTVIGEQPHNASAKIDCQTPNVQLSYALGKTETVPYKGVGPDKDNFYILDTSNKSPPQNPPLGSFQNYTDKFDLLAAGATEADSFNGYIILIKAKATDKDAITQFAESQEKAVRSVVTFEAAALPIKLPIPSSNKTSYLWLRGGEQETGGNIIADFPLSWSENDPDGIKLMTKKDGISPDKYYWMSWGISSKAYFRFIAGTIINGDLTGTSNGPKDWSWMMNQWATLPYYYPLYAGASLSLNCQYTNTPKHATEVPTAFPPYTTDSR